MTATATVSGDGRSLLGAAVHRSRALSVNGLLERAFTLAFRNLVYAQIWEDPIVDLEALDVRSDSRIVTIASGGCNVMSYLTADPECIFAVDLNKAHVALNRLKLVAAQTLPDHAAFHRFFGNAADSANVQAFDTHVAPSLDAETLTYWTGRDALGRRRISTFSRNFYHSGLLGRFITVAHAIGRAYGVNPRDFIKASSRVEQRAFFETQLAPMFDRRLVRKVLDNPMSLYGLGIPPAQYHTLGSDAPRMADVVCERLRKLTCDFDLADNYFAWAAFNRGYAADGKGPQPPYLQECNFEAVRARARRVRVEQVSFTTFLSRQPAKSLDRYVLLDAQDWMSEQDLTQLWRAITRTARTDARVIFRTAGAASILPGRLLLKELAMGRLVSSPLAGARLR